jgi:hypothetical protein
LVGAPEDEVIRLALELSESSAAVPPSASGADTERSCRRARAKLREIALCSDFKWFATLTLDGSKVGRYDEGEALQKCRTWLNNQVKRRGLAYVLVPERHKDGAIHFHALFSDSLEVVDSGTISLPGQKRPRRPRSDAQRAEWLAAGGHEVYNLPGWRWGFSSAIRLYGDYGRTINYVCKYIGKDAERIGGRWYLSGGPVIRQADVVLLDDVGVRDLAALHDGTSCFVRSFAAGGCGFALWRGSVQQAADILGLIGGAGDDALFRDCGRDGAGL